MPAATFKTLQGERIKVAWASGYDRTEYLVLSSTNSAGFWFEERNGVQGFAPWSAILWMREA